MEREEYTSCYLNGKKHIDLAIRLGQENDYGTAISFLILGLEELIKYLVVKHSLSDKSLFSRKEINQLFSSHAEKHKIIIEFLESTKPEFAENFVQSIFNKAMNRKLSAELQKVQANRFKELGSMVGLTEKHLTNIEIESFIEWLKIHADNLKNKGLYVNLKDKSNHLEKTELITPNNISEDDFKIALKFSDSFFKQITFSKHLDITEDEFIDLLNLPAD